jgi:AraC-like DNA-binding protein
MDLEADKPIADNVRELLRSSFADHRSLTARQCATVLEISVRGMQRRLRTIGFAFSELVDEIRFDLARDKLLNSNNTIDEILQALGYSTQASFIRAFQRWAGVTPSEFRRQRGVTSSQVQTRIASALPRLRRSPPDTANAMNEGPGVEQ